MHLILSCLAIGLSLAGASPLADAQTASIYAGKWVLDRKAFPNWEGTMDIVDLGNGRHRVSIMTRWNTGVRNARSKPKAAASRRTAWSSP